MDDAKDLILPLSLCSSGLCFSFLVGDLGVTDPLALVLLGVACLVSALLGIWLGMNHRRRCGRDG